jgi:hypothetical protein
VYGQTRCERLGVRAVNAQGPFHRLLNKGNEPLHDPGLFRNIQGPTVYVQEVGARFDLGKSLRNDLFFVSPLNGSSNTLSGGVYLFPDDQHPILSMPPARRSTVNLLA